MLDDSQKSSAFEQVKRMMRSVLLSSKNGVPLQQITRDYESLIGTRLPFRDFGFNDVECFMLSMPEVARERRMPDGEVLFLAVCDDTTANIQKLISNQKAPARRKRGGGLGFRGRGAFRGGRGSRGGYKSFGLSTRGASASAASKPRFPVTTRGGGGGRGRRGASGASSFTASSGDVRNMMNPSWTGGGLQDTSLLSSDRSDNEDCDKENQNVSTLTHNLQIGVSKNGDRTISKQTDLRDLLNAKRSHGDGTASNQTDLRDVLNAQRSRHISGDSRHSEGSGSSGKGDYSTNTENRFSKHAPMKRGANRPQRNTYMPKEVAPRFSRVQQENHKFSQDINSNDQSSAPLNDSYQETPACYTIASKNWMPPERGEEYFQTFHRYFAENNIPVPNIEIVPARHLKKNGFYGRLMYEGKLFFPLEILQTEEDARQNAARSFCLKFDISLPEENSPVKQTPSKDAHPQLSEAVSKSQPSEAVSRSQPSETVSKSQPSETVSKSQPSETVSKLPKPTTPVPESAPSSPISKDLKVKIYKILVPQGVFLKNLPDLFFKSYEEVLRQEVIDRMKDCPDFFNVEEPIPKRLIVYQVPDALSKISEAVMEECKCPAVQLPDVGSVFDAMFSFAYSADDMHFHKAESVDKLYSIKDDLASHCEGGPSPQTEHLAEGSLIAASYEDEWYRARVIKQDGAKVSVLFIDYGNKEEVEMSGTRLMPQNELLTNTPALAIPCMARKSMQGDWCGNVSEILTSVTESYPFLSMEVMHHAGTHCVIDVSLPDGRNVNAMLMRRFSDPALSVAPTTPSRPFSPQFSQTAFQNATPSTKAAAQLFSNTVQSPSSQSAKIFTEDPEPLTLPESNSFGAYVCSVMSESSVLIRLVDDEYSDKLDELEAGIAEKFDQWLQPAKIQPSNVYACILPEEEEEEGAETEDYNKFHRVRVLKGIDKEGSCECYLLDHGSKETVKKENIKHIDSALNASLPYQAVYATLYGLDSLPAEHSVIATKILIHLTVSNNGSTFYAVRKDPKQTAANSGINSYDKMIVDRVRKIISCLADFEPGKVGKIYEDIFGEKLNNVEEIIKLIPGYGFWKHALEVELIDSSEEDDETSINNTILTLLQEIAHLRAAGRDEKQAFKDVLGSDSSSQADTADTGSTGEPTDPESSGKTDSTTSNLPPATLDNGHDIPQKFFRNCPSIPSYIDYELNQFSAIYIVRSDSPSSFVGMPYEQREALSKLEQDMKDHFSNTSKMAVIFSKSCMYAVNRDEVWHRTLYVGQITHMHKVFYPDHHVYDIVSTDQLCVLPPQFYSLPLLARKMALGGVKPTNRDWSEAAKYWFIQNTQGKDLYALILSVDGQDPAMILPAEDNTASKCAHLPMLLYAQLVDTSGEEDVILDQQLCEKGWAIKVHF